MQANSTPSTRGSSFHRSIGLFTGTAINMTQMCGIGPFITIPIMVATMGGPQAVIGWIVGAILAVADGMVWAELGAAMPGSGGTYVYLREAFQYRTGKLMPFLFIWTVLLTIPLLMSTGIIGMVEYLGFFFPHLGWWPVHLIGLLATGLVTLLLYRRIESIRVITIALWVIMLLSVIGVSAAGFSDFHSSYAFSYPAGVFGGHFFVGLGAGLIIGIYDYLGYFTTAYMGDELRDPGRTMPGSIITSVVAMMFVYLILNISVLGVAPWQEIAHSTSVASLVVEHSWGHTAAAVMTLLIIVTAFASVFAGLLGGSRAVPGGARKGVPVRVRQTACEARLSARGAAHDGRADGCRHVLRPDRSHQHAAGRDHHRAVHRADRRAGGAAQTPAWAASTVPAMAVSGTVRDRAGGLDLRLRVGVHLVADPVRHLDRGRPGGVRDLGEGQPLLAVRATGNP